ncbi:hypothetical protein B0H14DRAFT_2568940 [Mycena olivaceomarginata]|nr:hypothetical protein B0H14DRAFT_2568940 [Mycena olivaceomarginata]
MDHGAEDAAERPRNVGTTVPNDVGRADSIGGDPRPVKGLMVATGPVLAVRGFDLSAKLQKHRPLEIPYLLCIHSALAHLARIPVPSIIHLRHSFSHITQISQILSATLQQFLRRDLLGWDQHLWFCGGQNRECCKWPTRPATIIYCQSLIGADLKIAQTTQIAFTQLNEQLEYIEEHDEYADIATCDSIIDESLSDDASDNAELNAKAAEPETWSSQPAETPVLHNYLLAVHKRLRQEETVHGKPLCYIPGDFFDRPLHPVFALERSKDTVGLDAGQLYLRNVFVWLPYLLPGHPDKFKCTCGKHLSKNGFNEDPIARRVRDMPSDFFLLTNRFICDSRRENFRGCGKSHQGTDSHIIAHLPRFVQAAFPAYISARGAISKLMMSQMSNTFASCFGPAPFSELVSEIQHRSHADGELMYLAAAEFYGRSGVKPYSTFNDPNGYAGILPSVQYIKALFTDYIAAHRIFVGRDIATFSLGIAKADHTFDVVPQALGWDKGTTCLQCSDSVAIENHMNDALTDLIPTASSSQLSLVALAIKTQQRDGQPDCLDIIQLRTQDKIYILKITALTSRSHILPSLRAILTNSSIIKIGHSIRQILQTISQAFLLPELDKILKEKNAPVLNLGKYAKLKGQVVEPSVSLHALAGMPRQARTHGQLVTLIQGCKPIVEGSIVTDHDGHLNAIMDDHGNTKKINGIIVNKIPSLNDGVYSVVDGRSTDLSEDDGSGSGTYRLCIQGLHLTNIPLSDNPENEPRGDTTDSGSENGGKTGDLFYTSIVTDMGTDVAAQPDIEAHPAASVPLPHVASVSAAHAASVSAVVRIVADIEQVLNIRVVIPYFVGTPVLRSTHLEIIPFFD